MPNIELHGFVGTTGSETRGRIIQAFADAPYKGLVVTSIINSDVRNLKGEHEPFLRIVAPTDSLEAKLADMKQRLIPLGFGIEVLPLLEYIEPLK